MSIGGLRIQIAGSAALETDGDLLGSAHRLVTRVTSMVIEAGAGMVVGVGDDPIGDAGIPCVFDWTVLEAVARSPEAAMEWPHHRPGRFRAVASQRGLDKIPQSRQDVWRKLAARSDVELETLPYGWRMGGVIRARQALHGDVLVLLGGGSGTEQLAELYLDEEKPVIPIRCALGALSGDGNGGASYLQERALSDISSFFTLREGAGGAAARLSLLALQGPDDVEPAAASVAALLQDLRPRRAFYVRLLDKTGKSHAEVEQFFREVVDPVVTQLELTPHEVGRGAPLAAFMNVEIFAGIHRAALVVVDLTDLRPNCMMELGYALGRHRRVIISAAKGTALPFDPDKLPTYFWDPTETGPGRVDSYRGWVERYIDMPPVVS